MQLEIDNNSITTHLPGMDGSTSSTLPTTSPAKPFELESAKLANSGNVKDDSSFDQTIKPICR